MPVIKIKHPEMFSVGDKVRFGATGPHNEIFDKKGDEILVGEPGKPPRQSKTIKCTPMVAQEYKPRHYIEHDGELCRIDAVEADGLVISRRARLN
jgi:hypothetical protein